ncbi:MAG: Uracil phosphoribosyltransferase [Chlamydiae bacterium]|nr:Uracil phosphoribosyltransferase [Chlamydiota bacterium]
MNTIKKSLMLVSVFFCLVNPLIAHHPAMEKELFTLREPATDRKAFRASMKKVGEYLALEVSKDLDIKPMTVETVLGVEATHNLVSEDIVLVTILRAGLPLLKGFASVFPDAEMGFFGMARDEETLKAKVDYIALPPMEGKTVIIVDPMIATGGSMLDAIKVIEPYNPKKIIVAGAFATVQGMERINKHNPNVIFYNGVVDPILNDVGYIVPGLGDAGDRAFGNKCR